MVAISFASWDPAQQSHELTPVAYSQAESVWPLVEPLELVLQSLVETNASRPSLGRVQNVRVTEASHKSNASERFEGGLAAEHVRHGNVPGFKASRVESRCHLSVTVASFFPYDCNLVLCLSFHDAAAGQFRGVRNVPKRRFADRQRSGFVLDTDVRALELLKLERTLLPHVSQGLDRGLHHVLAVDRDIDSIACRGSSDHFTANVLRAKERHDVSLISFAYFQNETWLLCEQGFCGAEFCQEVGFHATISRKGHLQEGGDQPAVADVMASRDFSSVNQALDDLKRKPQLPHVVNIRDGVAQRIVDLGVSRSSQTALAVSQINVKENPILLALEVWGDDLCDVRARAVRADHKVARCLDDFSASRSSHGQAILPSVARNAKRDH
mmetsp:Transcript_3757/g.10760  ORF Transcript_3757/g.10760 Transcript_3757/m.10760 type:complete len:384 (+) Transcript_3757:590-1741(+)